MLPNFVVVGAPKCGTTSLYQYLRQHPDVYLPAQKELHYFSREELARDTAGPGDANVLLHLCGSREAYRRHYAGVRGETAVGEVSPSYFDFPEVAERIRDELGAPRIIVMLRDPIGKAFSQYMHLVRDGRETLDFHSALLAEAERTRRGWSMIWRYAQSSLYAPRLRRYLETFGTDRVRIVIFREFIQSPQTALGDLWRFLGVDDTVRPDTSQVFNASSRPRSRLLAAVLGQRNPLRSLARAIVPQAARQRVVEGLRRLNAGAKEGVDDRSHAYLQDFFEEDVRETEAILGRQLPWLQ